MMIVDIDVWNCEIRAFKPELQSYMPNDDVGTILFWNTVESDMLNKRQLGYLKGKPLRKAARIVDKYGAINMSDIYGSMEIDEKDFVEVAK